MYFKIRVNTLVPDKPTTFDLHLFLAGQAHLYLRAGEILAGDRLRSLSEKDTGEQFLVLEADRGAYRTYVRTHMKNDELNTFKKAKMLRESALSLVEELFEVPDVHKALDGSRPMVQDFMHFMESEPGAMQHLIGLSGHDFYTFNHSLDVAIYSLGLGSVLGFTPAELEELGVGAIFHDIGKRNVPLDILTKKGALNDPEWVEMQKHPSYGLAILSETAGVSDAIKASCFEHHESFLGNGYPQKLSGEEIHPFARIIAITDTYDAMTTQRSYNNPLKPREALAMMRDKLSGRYDQKMLQAMYGVLFKIEAA